MAKTIKKKNQTVDRLIQSIRENMFNYYELHQFLIGGRDKRNK